MPAAQLRDQTAWSLDKHLAYGIWFGAIAAGYGCNQLIRWLPGASRQLASICCIIGIAFIGATSWQSAWDRYHAWPDASTFISAFRLAATESQGLIYVPGQEANIAEYYTAQGRDWTRWNASLSLDPPAMSQKRTASYYTAQLHGANYGVIALFYSTTFCIRSGVAGESPSLPSSMVADKSGTSAYRGEGAESPVYPH